MDLEVHELFLVVLVRVAFLQFIVVNYKLGKFIKLLVIFFQTFRNECHSLAS